MNRLVKTLCAFSFLAFAFAGCKETPQEVDVTIRLNKELISNLPVGSEQTLVATVLPEGTEVSVIWSSDNEKVAVVNDEGVVTGVAPGTATITAMADAAKATCKVTVTAVEPTRIELSHKTLELNLGDEFTLEVNVFPENAVADDLEWSTTNDKVATVTDGVVKAVAKGDATITVKCNRGALAAVCQVRVIEEDAVINPTAIALAPESMSLKVGEKGTLTVTFTPANAEVTDLVWETSNNEVAAVDDGVVSAIKAGEAIITAKCLGGDLSSSCKVTVTGDDTPGPGPEIIPVTEIKMQSTLSLEVGKSETLAVTVLPDNATDKSVSFVADNACVEVDQNGKVTAVKAGTAKVTARSADGSGVEAECVVTVTDPVPEEDKLITVAILPNGSKADVQVGLTHNLNLTFVPSEYEPKEISWTVDNEALAVVDQNGVITGKLAEKGTDGNWINVVVSVNVDGVTSNLRIRVIPRQADDIMIDMPEGNQLRVGEGWYFNPRITPEGLGFQMIAISDPFGNISDSYYTCPVSPGRYSYMFAISDHEDLVQEYAVRKSEILDVIPYWVASVSIPETYELEAGASATLTPSFTSDVDGHQPTYKDVIWSSSDNTVATVNENTGEITALKAGTVEIVATTSHSWSVPSGEPQKSATCVLTVKEPAVELNIGDYYYSDGTWSSDLDSSKEVIGIVFSKVNAAASDTHLAADYPGCSHGLVLSTEEYAAACISDRSWALDDLGRWCSDNGYPQYYDLEKPVGYSNTVGYEAANAAGIQSYGDTIDFSMFNSSSLLTTHRNSVATPSTASCWYVPSYKEMVMLYENVTVVNEKLAAVGGDTVSVSRASYYDVSYLYWCSSFDLISRAVRVFSMLDGGWNASAKPESTQLGFRVILAF